MNEYASIKAKWIGNGVDVGGTAEFEVGEETTRIRLDDISDFHAIQRLIDAGFEVGRYVAIMMPAGEVERFKESMGIDRTSRP